METGRRPIGMGIPICCCWCEHHLYAYPNAWSWSRCLTTSIPWLFIIVIVHQMPLGLSTLSFNYDIIYCCTSRTQTKCDRWLSSVPRVLYDDSKMILLVAISEKTDQTCHLYLKDNLLSNPVLDCKQCHWTSQTWLKTDQNLIKLEGMKHMFSYFKIQIIRWSLCLSKYKKFLTDK